MEAAEYTGKYVGFGMRRPGLGFTTYYILAINLGRIK